MGKKLSNKQVARNARLAAVAAGMAEAEVGLLQVLRELELEATHADRLLFASQILEVWREGVENLMS